MPGATSSWQSQEGSSSKSSEEKQPRWHLDFQLPASRTVKQSISAETSLWQFVMEALGNQGRNGPWKTRSWQLNIWAVKDVGPKLKFIPPAHVNPLWYAGLKKNACCKLIKSTWLYTPDVQDIVRYSWHSQMSLPNSPSSHCQHLMPLPNHEMKVFSGQHLAWPLSGCHLHTKISAMGGWG